MDSMDLILPTTCDTAEVTKWMGVKIESGGLGGLHPQQADSSPTSLSAILLLVSTAALFASSVPVAVPVAG